MNNSAGKLNTEISIQLYSRLELKCLSNSLSTIVLSELWKVFYELLSQYVWYQK